MVVGPAEEGKMKQNTLLGIVIFSFLSGAAWAEDPVCFAKGKPPKQAHHPNSALLNGGHPGCGVTS